MKKISLKLFLLTLCLSAVLTACASSGNGNKSTISRGVTTIVNGTLTGKGFACVIANNGRIYSEVGIESCDELVTLNNLQDGTYVKIEIVPDNNETYQYLHPEDPWRMIIDSTADTSWLTDTEKKAAIEAFNMWKNDVYDFNKDGIFDFDTDLNPLISFTDITKINSLDLESDDISQEIQTLFVELVTNSIAEGIGPKQEFSDEKKPSDNPGEMDRNLPSEFSEGPDPNGAGGGGSREQAIALCSALSSPSIATDIWNNFNDVWKMWMDYTNVGSVINSLGGPRNVGGFQGSQQAAYFNSLFKGANTTSQLLNLGFVASSDGTTYRMHNAAVKGLADGIVYEYTPENTDRAFAAVVDESGHVYWSAGIDSSEELINIYADELKEKTYVKINILPEGIEIKKNYARPYEYLYPDKAVWTLYFNGEKSKTAPLWWTIEHSASAMDAFNSWKETVYDFDLEGLLVFFDSLPSKPQEVTELDKLLLKEYISFNASGGGSNEYDVDSSATWSGSTIWDQASGYLSDAFSIRHVECPGPTVCGAWERYYNVKMTDALKNVIGGSTGLSGLTGLFFNNNTTWNSDADGTYPLLPGAMLMYHSFLIATDNNGKWWLISGKLDKDKGLYPEIMLEWTTSDAEKFAPSPETQIAYEALKASYGGQ